MIDYAKWNSEGAIVVSIDGKEHTVPNSMDNRHRAMLKDWEDAGNLIQPFKPEQTPGLDQ
nr:hypothetical protein [Brucella anthropi]